MEGMSHTKQPSQSHLQSAVLGGGQDVVSAWMEGDGGHPSCMRWVVLQQTVAPSVPQFDAVVATASRHCGTIWMEPNIINRPGKKKAESKRKE